MSETSEAWNDFWARPGRGQSTGCLPARWQSVFAELERQWRGFAETLPQGAKVLDLATGDGRVLHWLGQARADIARVGVDLAPRLPPPPPGVEVRAGVPMEDLPFEHDQFDGVISQFGIEYGDPPAIAREIAQVAKADARIAFVVHRADGAILAHNLSRAEQIRWVIEELDLIGATKAAIADEAPPWADTVAQVAERVAEGQQRYGENSAGWEIPEALRQSLVMGARAGDTAQGVTSLLDRIEAQARNELARTASLERACRTAAARDGFIQAFEAAGIVLEETCELHDAAGRVFGEMLHFHPA